MLFTTISGMVASIGAQMAVKSALDVAVPTAVEMGRVNKALVTVGKYGLAFAAGDVASNAMSKRAAKVEAMVTKKEVRKEDLMELVDSNLKSTAI